MNNTNNMESMESTVAVGGEFCAGSRGTEQGGGNTIIKLTPNSKTVVNTEEHFECCSSCY